MDHSKKSTYLFSIDALRVIAIIAVVLIHTTTKTLQSIDHNVGIAPITLLLNQEARFAVPLFFLISGFVLELNNKSVSYLTFFKKRAVRVIFPYIFWSTLYFLPGIVFTSANVLIHGGASYHLYFIPTLIIFYLLFPLLHKFLGFFKKIPVVISLTIFELSLLFYDYYIQKLPFKDDVRVAALCLSIFILGMVASTYHEKIFSFIKRFMTPLVLLTMTVGTFIFIHVFDMTLSLSTTRFIYNQHSPLNFLYTILLSVTLMGVLEKTKLWQKGFILLSKLSFFVFFIHIFILEFVWKNIFSTLGPLFDFPFFLTVTILSFSIAYAFHKIPYVSKLTG